MASTRFVIAFLATVVFLAALGALRLDRDIAATWLMAIGSGLGTAWAILNVAWSADHTTMLSSEAWLGLVGTGGLLTVFLGLRALEGRSL